MSEFQTVVDKKFAEAQELFLMGKNALHSDRSPNLSLNYELIGLDCNQGDKFRYLISRTSLDTPTPILEQGMFDSPVAMPITHQLVRMSRPLGDARPMEELPKEAWTALGNWLFINAENDTGIEVEGLNTTNKVLDAATLGKLATELSGMRVSEDLRLR